MNTRRALAITLAAAALAAALAGSLPRAGSDEGADSLYVRIGGERRIVEIIDALRKRNAANPITAARLQGANGPRIRKGLIEVLAQRSGGPQVYRGPSMIQAHAGMGLTDAEYDAFMANFAGAIDDASIRDPEKGELIGIFAALRKEIVGSPPDEASKLARLEAEVRGVERRLAEIERKLDLLIAGGAAPRPVTAAASARPAKAAPAVVDPGWTEDERKLADGLLARYSATRNTGGGGDPHPELIGRRLEQTRFVSATGETLDLADHAGKKVVLVILRGFAGTVCIHCSAQTLAIARGMDEFRKRGAEVFLVYPGRPESIPAFIAAVRSLREGFEPPFPILLDADLVAVRTFRIEGNLAKPATIVLDQSGTVRWAYVGKQPSDRPSVTEILAALDAP